MLWPNQPASMLVSMQFTFGCGRGHQRQANCRAGWRDRVRVCVLRDGIVRFTGADVAARVAEISGQRLVQVPMESVVCGSCCCCGKISHAHIRSVSALLGANRAFVYIAPKMITHSRSVCRWRQNAFITSSRMQRVACWSPHFCVSARAAPQYAEL